jgi:hypothetical protein
MLKQKTGVEVLHALSDINSSSGRKPVQVSVAVRRASEASDAEQDPRVSGHLKLALRI